MVFANFSSLIPIFKTCFAIGIEKLIHFSIFYPKQVNCLSNFSASSFMIWLYS